MKYLNDLWILTKTGALVFDKAIEKVADEQFFAMLLSVLNTYAEEIGNGGLSSFELGNKRFYMSERNSFIFIGDSLKKIKEKTAKRELEDIIKLFFHLYPTDLAETWDGNLKIFYDFEEEIEKKYK